MHNPSQETLECEKCQDTNIHQLIIIRYGGQDISLVCQTCFAKEDEKPSTQYTLQNGSILRNVENYFKVRDLSCVLCDNDSHLSVDKNDTNYVACYKCIKEKQLDQSRQFVKESDDDFLYVLLGIKEHVKPSVNSKAGKFKRQRKVGRGKKGGKVRGRKPRDNKAPPANRINTPSENKESLRTFQALSKSQVAKVKPEDEKYEPTANIVKTNNKSSSDSSSRSSKKFPSHGANGANGANSGASSGASSGRSTAGRNTPRSTTPRSSTPRSSTPRSSTPRSSTPKPQKSGKSNAKDNKQSVNNVTTGIKDLKLSDVAKESNGKSGKAQAKKENKSPVSSVLSGPKKQLDSKGKKPGNPENPANGNPIPSSQVVKGDKKGPKSSPVNNSAMKGAKEVAARGPKIIKDDKPVKGKKDKQNGKPAKDSKPAKGKQVSQPSKPPKPEPPKRKEPVVEEEYEELEHIPKYLKNKPLLSYDSLNEYFKEMCFHLYLEEKSATAPITEFSTEWHKDNKNLFKVTIPYTEEIEKLVPPKLRNLGKLPFTMNQSIFVAKANDKDNIWDCFVKDLNVIKKGRKKIELLLELYKWNNSDNFPIGSSSLSIVPCSATISRILFAMARIENPKFIKMLLGKEPIKQINFKNRLQFTKPTFNDSQKNAIQHVLNNAITVLQGPPGTGKTSTIYEIILQLLRNLKTYPILVVAASNIAIDNIAEKLKNDNDLNILRIVSTEKEREYNEKHHLYDICLHQQVFNRLPEKNKDTLLDMRYNRQPVSQNQYKKMLTVSNSITEKLVAQAQVILTTTVVAGGYQLKSIKKLPVVIMDESTQSSEASSLIPLSMPGVDRFIFVGDDKQLSSFSEVPYLEQSMFERVLRNDTYKNPHMLNVQYRMHPKISEFPIKTFYNNMLTDGVTEEDRFVEGINPLVFVDYGSKHKEVKVSNFKRFNGGGYTYTNPGEAQMILKILKDLIYTKNIDKKDISVITPYSAQRDLLATMIQKDDLINPNNEDIEEEVDEDSLTSKKPTTIKTICNIMVSSIDAFQGREKNFVIFSCVRSNDENKIGFVKDARRLNVALTRARNGLILVGNKECMSKGDHLWECLIKHMEQKQSIVLEEYV